MKKVITGRSETENILIHLPWVLKFLYKSTAKFLIKLEKSDAPWAYVVGNKTSWLNEKNLSKVSIIGSGMRNQPGIAAKMFECLSKNKINIEVISTSEIKISVLINKDKTEEAVNALHAVFQLDQI